MPGYKIYTCLKILLKLNESKCKFLKVFINNTSTNKVTIVRSLAVSGLRSETKGSRFEPGC